MSEARFIPLWYTIASRGIVVATFVGLIVCILEDRYRVPMPFALGMYFAPLALFGGPAFILLRWIGVERGYVSKQDGQIYIALLIAVLVVIAILIATRI